MDMLQNNLSRATVTLPSVAFHRMIRLIRLLDKLSRNPLYRQEVFREVPETARFDPGHASVMMCYDFHLVDDVPKLIEVNTNAGGGLLAYLAHHPELSIAPASLHPALKKRLLRTFAEEFSHFSADGRTRPEHIVIIDEKPEEQYLYPEMCAFADLFREWGIEASIADPRQLQSSAEGVWLNGKPVDFLYNRHCDFYLDSDEMAGIKAAYIARKVCLSPNPHMYGLLADKRRLAMWSDEEKCQPFLGEDETALLKMIIPRSRLLVELDREEVWSVRKTKAFKPVDSFGSRGVLMGEKLSRKRFDQLPPETTLIQDLVPPSITTVPDAEPMKTDLRLYAYRNRVLGVTARLYRGQVTNLRTPGGGFAQVKIV